MRLAEERAFFIAELQRKVTEAYIARTEGRSLFNA
jgi:hypothetical protein